MSNQKNNTMTALAGVTVGHASDMTGGTGVSVILFERPAMGAVDISGMATSTRQTDSLDMMHPGTQIHAICFAGGSAFGLNAAAGVSFYLEEKGIGLDLGVAKLPIVPTSVIYDLSFMDPQARPTPEMAYEACLEASSAPVVQGCVGVGTGATSGKLRGMENATKSGIGSSMVEGSNGIKMGSIVVANPFGDILDETGAIVAGARDGKSFINSFQSIAAGETRSRFGSPSNTTLCLLVTNAGLDKIMAMQVARMAGHGLSKHISPFNTPFDGDMVFCLSIGEKQADPLHLGIIAARAAREALLSAVRHAHGLGGIPAAGDL